MSHRALALAMIWGVAFSFPSSPPWIGRAVADDLPLDAVMTVAAKGQFRDADAAHRGKGTATIFVTGAGARILRLTEFEATAGPDLKVWLVKTGGILSSADVKASAWLSLGPLKGSTGDQDYSIPADANLANYKSVVIWCEEFGVLFSAADLEPGS